MSNSLYKFIDMQIRRVMDTFGYAVMSKKNPRYHLSTRLRIIENNPVDLLLDVGANRGQYAKSMRMLGYKGKIISFEPMKAPFMELQAESGTDRLWECHNYGLGREPCEVDIKISKNSVSSSILDMLPEHKKHAPNSVVIGRETIEVIRLDMVDDSKNWENAWLKIDVQGLEDQVLDGASGIIKSVSVIQIELSLRPLYSGQLTILPMMQKLSELGFEAVAFEPGFYDKKTGELLQVDGIFKRRTCRGR